MTKPFDKVMTGLRDAQAYLKGTRKGFAVHEVEVPEPNDHTAKGREYNESAVGTHCFPICFIISYNFFLT